MGEGAGACGARADLGHLAAALADDPEHRVRRQRVQHLARERERAQLERELVFEMAARSRAPLSRRARAGQVLGEALSGGDGEGGAGGAGGAAAAPHPFPALEAHLCIGGRPPNEVAHNTRARSCPGGELFKSGEGHL